MIAFAPIVEGYGEVESIRLLIERVWRSLDCRGWPQVLHPIRQPKGRLVQAEHLERAVTLAALKLRGKGASRSVILLLLDADEDCPGQLGPRLLEVMRSVRPDFPSICCIVNVEYETWFVASAGSMGDLLDLGEVELPAEPEQSRLGKAWIAQRFAMGRYRETVDQPRLTARIDASSCRERSPSFDKLCRDIERIVRDCGN
jgi:Domain of unknown function (DUF4276)